MFGAVPGNFRVYDAAKVAAKAYEKEEEKEWVVVAKKIGEKINFEPCRFQDLEKAKEEGYHRCIKDSELLDIVESMAEHYSSEADSIADRIKQIIKEKWLIV